MQPIQSDDNDHASRPGGSFEERIFGAGLVIAVLFVLWIGASVLWMPGQTPSILAVTGAHIAVGRAAGIYLGLTTGLNLAIVLMINFIIDTLWVLLMYPIVIFTMKRLLSFGWIEQSVRKIVDAAQKRRALIDRYGVAGLFVFVVCPLPMTGPIVGGVIGNLIGLSDWTNIGVILSATYVSLALWAVILVGLYRQLEGYGSIAVASVLVLLIVVGMLGKIYYHKREESRRD